MDNQSSHSSAIDQPLSKEEVADIIRQNEENNRRLFSPYNPLTGEGSPISRTKLFLTSDSHILIPDYLASTPLFQELYQYQSVTEYVKQKGLDWKEFEEALHKIRIKYDFEYWAATCATIKDKTSGEHVKFILRKAQRKLVRELVTDLFVGMPVRIILLKARQWGGSTLVQMFMGWIQIYHRINWNSVIVAHQKDPARNIRSMYSTMAEKHPAAIADVRFRGFEGSSTNKQLVGRGSVVSIGSMERPDALRSDDIKLAHFSEVGLYKETKGKKPEDFITAIVSSTPSDPFTVVVLESTAKGIGNYFHNTWCEAEAGENAYKPVFVAWWEIDIYYKRFYLERQMQDFIQSMTPDEKYRFSLGATLEGLNWYREKRKELPNDWQMCCEFPSTPQEAFATTARFAHNPQYIEQMRPYTKGPIYVGEMMADASAGKEAINNSLRFVEKPTGELKLWALPDKANKIRYRYVVSLDIGGRTDQADWSVISVVDRFFLKDGGVEECIGTYRFHLDQDLTVWRAVQVARFFNDALLVVESNSLDIKKQEGDHSMTILDEIKDYYSNIYFRDDPQKIKEGMPTRYGFHTNIASKTDLINQMNKRLRELGYIERDKAALDEASYYEMKDDGSYGAIDGKHDDIHMSRAIALKASSTIPMPAVISGENKPEYLSKSPSTISSESTF